MTSPQRDYQTEKNIEDALRSSFIDASYASDLEFKPQMVLNDPELGQKVISALEKELLRCEEFAISVAFITESGIAPLLQTFKILEERGIKGRVLTTNYLSFSEPKALKKLAAFTNIELRMYYVSGNEAGFHPKAYIFNENRIYKIIIGSSNLTARALTTNHEWNVRLISTEQGEYIQQIRYEYDKLWDKADSLETWIDKYTEFYETQKKYTASAPVPNLSLLRLEPNSMQMKFMENLKKIRDRNEKRALLISATGTGKTYAAAFAARDMDPNRILFLVHREQIANQALATFKNVFVETKTYGIISGQKKETDAGIVFSTIQSMSKPDIMKTFSRDHFDLIIIDEVHRAGASSYEIVMNYFTPEFYLGMTASPDRPDGFDIYKLFHNNIAHEIRLQQAMEEELLCPFHYYGITDITIDGIEIDEDGVGDAFNMLVSDARVDHVIEQISYFGYSGDRVKGLIFCSKNEEAKSLSGKFNERGFRTIALSGANSQAEREKAIDKLATGENDNSYDYIFSVDIFNEGVDIPEINQVVMLRPTESAIIFVQQLGRGLRKNPGKEYVMVLDFIANYRNNFLIPIALSGDRTYNKDNIRHYLMDASKVIPGSSSIHFDEIVKKKIYDSISTIKNDGIRFLREKYRMLKFKLGRIPSIVDFYEYGEIDPMLILGKTKTYYNFLINEEDEYDVHLNKTDSALLTIFSGLIVNGQRPHEAVILRALLEKDIINVALIADILKEEFQLVDDEKSILSAFNYLSGLFSIQPDSNWFDIATPIEKINDTTYKKTAIFAASLQNNDFTTQVNDLIDFGIKKFINEFMSISGAANLALYKKYSRKDVCRILNWGKEENPQNMGGYRIKYDTCPIFVTLHKDENIAESIKYDDRFLSRKAFTWMTRSRVKEDSTEAVQIINSKEAGLPIYLFVKKSDDHDGKDYYYVGRLAYVNHEQCTQPDGKGNNLPIVRFDYEIETPVREELYDYLIT